MAKKKEKEIVDINSLTPEEKKKRIAQAMDTLREFSPMVSFLDNAMSNVKSFEDTGCYILNALVSGHLRGGFPEARMSLLAAESSTGKTYLALQTAAKAQRAGKQIVIFDSEFAIDHEFATPDSTGVSGGDCRKKLERENFHFFCIFFRFSLAFFINFIIV